MQNDSGAAPTLACAGVGYANPAQSVPAWAGHMILPWITLATVSAAVYSRLSRGSLLETLAEDYIRTARAKGLPEHRVILRHHWEPAGIRTVQYSPWSSG